MASKPCWLGGESEVLKHPSLSDGSVETATILRAISKLEDKLDTLLRQSSNACSQEVPVEPLLTECTTPVSSQMSGDMVHTTSSATIDDLAWLVPRRHSRASGDSRERAIFSGLTVVITDSFTHRTGESASICSTTIVTWLKTWWDVFAILSLLFDAALVPYALAWETAAAAYVGFFSVKVSIVFWSLDMAFNFFLPYENKTGVNVTKFRGTASYYLRGWFVFDAVMLSVDFFVLISMTLGGGSAASWVRFARTFKVARCARALQRLQGDSFKAWLEYAKFKAARFGLETSFSFVVGSLQYVVFFICINHFGSCIWWISVKNTERSLELSWSKDLRTEFGEDLFENRDYNEVMYLKGWYFTLISLLSCSSPLTTNTPQEMVLSLTIALAGWLLSCVFLSNLAAALVEYKTSRSERERLRYQLRQYLRQNHVSVALAVSIQRQVHTRTQTKHRVCKQDVTALNIVSPQLLRCLDIDVHEPHFACEPLLGALGGADKAFLKTLCLCEDAFSVFSVEPGFLIFDSDQACECALFIIHGDMLYTGRIAEGTAAVGPRMSSANANQVSRADGSVTCSIQVGRWVASVCLCVHWQTQGFLESSTYGEMLGLRASAMWDVLKKFDVLTEVVFEYSKAMVAVLRGMGSDSFNDMIADDGDVKSSVLCRLPHQQRKYLSLHVLDFIKEDTNGKFSSKCKRELEDEVNGRKSSLYFVNGAPQRLVFLAVVELWRDGEHLVEVGTVSEDGIFVKAKPQHPATKCQMDETSEAAAARIIQQSFSSLWLGPLIQGTETREKMTSATYALPSCYMKQTFHAHVEGDCEFLWAEVFGQLPMESGRPVNLLVAREATGSTGKPRKVYAWLDEYEWTTWEGSHSMPLSVRPGGRAEGGERQFSDDCDVFTT